MCSARSGRTVEGEGLPQPFAGQAARTEVPGIRDLPATGSFEQDAAHPSRVVVGVDLVSSTENQPAPRQASHGLRIVCVRRI